MSEYSKLTLSFIFQNHNFFRFSWHIIELVCRMVTIFLPTQRSRLSEPPRYLQRVRKGYRKFSRHIWEKSFCSKYEVLSKYSNLTLSFIYIFRAETISQMCLENFLLPLRTRLKYLGGSLNLDLCVGKKIVTIRHTNSIICQEKRKKLWFWKMKLKVSLEYSDKTSCF